MPEGLDWDLWVGPAPWRPYNSRFHRNPPPGVVPWAFCEDFGAASVTWHHSHSADVIQYALGVENSGPVEIVHPVSGEFPTLTYRYANGTLLHLVDNWGMVKSLYGAVPAGARLAGKPSTRIAMEAMEAKSMGAAGGMAAGDGEMAVVDREVGAAGTLLLRAISRPSTWRWMTNTAPWLLIWR